MTWREISADQYNALKKATLIDVRSPGEYKVERIPGAVNVPLFTDAQRDFVGTIHANEGEIVARRKAMNIIAPKIPALIDDIVKARGDDHCPIVIHCWRGGLRSEAVASCLSIVGIDCWRLTGGYKAWRSIVVRDFSADAYDLEMIALQGHTGVGKTEILAALKKLGAQVIDLEALACHRGSVFGALGQASMQPSQKDFETALWFAMRALKADAGPVFVEAESRNIGRISLPAFIFKRITVSPKILITGSMPARCQRILSDYVSLSKHGQTLPPGIHIAANQALSTIQTRLPGAVYIDIQRLVADGQLTSAVELLLTHYYDHYYQKWINAQTFSGTVSGDIPLDAAKQILALTAAAK